MIKRKITKVSAWLAKKDLHPSIKYHAGEGFEKEVPPSVWGGNPGTKVWREESRIRERYTKPEKPKQRQRTIIYDEKGKKVKK